MADWLSGQDEDNLERDGRLLLAWDLERVEMSHVPKNCQSTLGATSCLGPTFCQDSHGHGEPLPRIKTGYRYILTVSGYATHFPEAIPPIPQTVQP